MKTAEYYGKLKPTSRENILKIAADAIARDLIGGLINTTYDYPEDSTEYKEAVKELANTEFLRSYIYDELMELEFVYTGPAFGQGVNTTKYLRFAGKEAINNAIYEAIENNR